MGVAAWINCLRWPEQQPSLLRQRAWTRDESSPRSHCILSAFSNLSTAFLHRLALAQCERMLSASAVKQSLSSSDLFCRHLLIFQRLINLSFRKTLARKGVTLTAVSRHCSQVRKIHVESIFQ